MTPATPEVAVQRLQALLALGPMLIAHYGGEAEVVREVYHEAQMLSEAVGTVTQQFAALCGFWVYAITRAEPEQTRLYAPKLLELACDSGEATILQDGHHVMGNIAFRQGKLLRARQHLTESVAQPNVTSAGMFTSLQSVESRIASGGYPAWVLFVLGYPDQARQSLNRRSSPPVPVKWVRQQTRHFCGIVLELMVRPY
ncbi:MAG: hypothetical protein AB7G75_29625 [Candidatus Binatia bacterium]